MAVPAPASAACSAPSGPASERSSPWWSSPDRGSPSREARADAGRRRPVIDLARRATEGEMLDEGVPDDEALRSLADLRLVDRWLGNRRAFQAAVLPFLEGAA